MNERYESREWRTDGRFDGTPTRDLLREFVTNGQDLVREEIRLAKLEIRDEVKKSAKAAGMAAGGGVAMHTGALTLVAAVVLLLATFMPAWLGALLVGAALVGAGAFLAKKNVERIKVQPTQTTRTLKEDQVWAKQTIRDAKSRVQGNA